MFNSTLKCSDINLANNETDPNDIKNTSKSNTYYYKKKDSTDELCTKLGYKDRNRTVNARRLVDAIEDDDPTSAENYSRPAQYESITFKAIDSDKILLLSEIYPGDEIEVPGKIFGSTYRKIEDEDLAKNYTFYKYTKPTTGGKRKSRRSRRKQRKSKKTRRNRKH